MAEKKTQTKNSRSGTSKTTAKAPAKATNTTNKTGKKSTTQKKAQPQAEQTTMPIRVKRDENSILHRFLPYLFVVCAVLLGVCFIFHDGAVGKLIYDIFFGLFGLVSVLLPFLLGYFAAFWRRWVADDQHVLKCIFAVICIVFGGALVQIILIATAGSNASDFLAFTALFANGQRFVGGGVIGGTVGILFYKAFAAAAGIILTGAVVLIFGIFLFGITPRDIWINLKYSIKMHHERRLAAEAKAKSEREFAYESYEESDGTAVPPELQEPFDSRKPFETAVPKADFDMNFSDGEFATVECPAAAAPAPAPADPTPVAPDPAPFEIIEEPEEEPERGGERIDLTKIEEKPEEKKSVYNQYGEIDLGAIFTEAPAAEAEPMEYDEYNEPEDDGERGGVDIGDALSSADSDTLTVTTEEVETFAAPPAPPKPAAPAYRFPPITLLAEPEKKKNEDVGAELRQNAQKLVETLKSFHVNVSVSSVSRGPTITRYELIPEAGTRVRSIANLVDDISLSLATSGIRIEAPIPGKAAVGIEVPNRTVSTVTLRELIENKAFTEAKSKLTVCLGKDVGGAPIVFDIAKMPHLLIAGATGMGKSVCINSIITSILYKATPDEVKLILIDPKKVEFNIYNGIPHLQIPVVSEPKKAAGALHWAVTEMERRYELIEEVGARKIEPYNEIARERGMEVLPYTVIIIAELADLMMTAPDAVEDSICRLAQKARAAGMHIIIGTQRPSVDVITGLIKANIPSRIAFTVASQVDSRTIIDIAGAEKLIGRGDMLYYPVGLSKPMRAQGAFVSEDEVEKITAFVKQSVGETEYDSDILESIEREAQAIGQSSKKGGGDALADDGAGDAKLRDALEIATDLGKISTSLLQRKLSIGYGRAAKIIDIMEARGFVSAPDGQKPREVLITKTQFREMVVNNDERIN